ncbi:hypothetical protein [Amycolatopsis sp. NPDC004169]
MSAETSTAPTADAIRFHRETGVGATGSGPPSGRDGGAQTSGPSGCAR